MESALKPHVESGKLPGAISVLIDDKANKIDVACVGWANIEEKRPIAMDQLFMQCSQTKGFCGVTIAMLVEEGKISLDDPVSKYLPEFKEMKVRTKDKNGKEIYEGDIIRSFDSNHNEILHHIEWRDDISRFVATLKSSNELSPSVVVSQMIPSLPFLNCTL